MGFALSLLNLHIYHIHQSKDPEGESSDSIKVGIFHNRQGVACNSTRFLQTWHRTHNVFRLCDL